MNKKAQIIAGVVGSKVVQWIVLILLVVLVGFIVYKISPDAAAIMFFVGALLFYAFVFFIFAYFWYFVGKWVYYIVKNAKVFIQKAVNWIMAIFE